MANNNKVKFGLDRVYYAVATIADDGSATYGTPKPLRGAVSLSLEAQGDNSPFYADNIVYFMAAANAGYNGDLELALIPDDFKVDVLGYKYDSNNILYEESDAVAQPFALLFQFSGDQHKVRHVLYNCTATRPAIGSATIEETAEPQTETVTVTASAVYNAALDANIIKARVTPDESAQYSAWYNGVYQSGGAQPTP